MLLGGCVLGLAVLHCFCIANGQYDLTGPTTAEQGSTVTYTCTTSPVEIGVYWREMSGSNGSIYIYFYNSEEGRCQRSTGAPPSDYTFDCNSTGVFSLSFLADYSRHRGSEFQCGSAAGGGGSISITLTVTVQVSSVTLTNITNNNQQVPVNQDSNLVLTCQTSPAYPAPTVTWYVRSSMTSSGVDSRTETQSNGQMIAVSTITRTMRKNNDQDTFYCRAKNINSVEGTQSKTAKANVFYGPDANMVNLTKPAVITELDIVTLTCSTLTQVNPEVEFNWSYGDNTAITAGLGNKKGVARGSWSQTLTVRALRDSNRQEIRCDVINTKTSRSEQVVVDLDVRYPPDISLPPVEGPQDTDLTLICIASGNPRNYRFEDFRQYRGNQLIQRRKGTQTGDRYSLDLPQVSYQDSGVYVCTVGNNVKQPMQKNTTVTVEASPVFTRDADLAHPVGVEVRQTARLVQYVYCSPNFTSVSWHFNTANTTTRRLSTDSSSVNSGLVNLEVYGTQVEVAGFKLIYTVTNFRENLVGIYTVSVCNRMGCSESSLKLVASGPPKTPLHFKALSSTTDSVTLTWTPQYAGGDYTQEFHVEFRMQNTSADWESKVFQLSRENCGAGTVDGLDSNTGYVFRIVSVTDRKAGDKQSPVSEQIYISTKDVAETTAAITESPSLGVGAGIGIGTGISLILVLAGVGVVVVLRRRACLRIQRAGGQQKPEGNVEARDDTAVGSRPDLSMYSNLERSNDGYEIISHIHHITGMEMEHVGKSPHPQSQHYENLNDDSGDVIENR